LLLVDGCSADDKSGGIILEDSPLPPSFLSSSGSDKVTDCTLSFFVRTAITLISGSSWRWRFPRQLVVGVGYGVDEAMVYFILQRTIKIKRLAWSLTHTW